MIKFIKACYWPCNVYSVTPHPLKSIVNVLPYAPSSPSDLLHPGFFSSILCAFLISVCATCRTHLIIFVAIA